MDLDMKHAHAASGRFLINLALILSLFIGLLRNVKLEDYVHNFYLLECFKATYHFVVNLMVD